MVQQDKGSSPASRQQTLRKRRQQRRPVSAVGCGGAAATVTLLALLVRSILMAGHCRMLRTNPSDHLRTHARTRRLRPCAGRAAPSYPLPITHHHRPSPGPAALLPLNRCGLGRPPPPRTAKRATGAAAEAVD